MKWHIIIVAFLIAGCSSAYHFKSKGHFIGPVEGDQNVFVTVIDTDGNNIPRITEGPHSYFAWKTVKYNYRVDSTTTFSTYRTLLNKDAPHLAPDEIDYLKMDKRLLNNYLFFIDDYRFYYLSEDDDRKENGYGLLPLYFEKDNYPIKIDFFGSEYDQLARGYYHLDSNKLFLDFEDEQHFYVRATYDSIQQSIQFDSIAVPNKDVLKRAGMNNIYVAFDKSIDTFAQPIFEKPNPHDVIPERDFFLTSGWSIANPTKEHYIDSLLNAQYPKWRTASTDIIHHITYSYEDNKIERIYEIDIGLYWPDIIKVTEDMGNIITW